ncbi:cytochrome c3 family protein [Calditrichota bacterium LG25]
MKKGLILSLSLLLSIAGVAYGQKFLNSPHDFTNSEWNISDNSCSVCHTEDGEGHKSVKQPLWEHNYKEITYNVYQSNTLNAKVGQPTGISKLCLSCHDGTIALNNFGGGLQISKYIPAEAQIGTDLRNNHPVSFVYDSKLAEEDGGLYDPASSESGLGATIQQDLLIDNQLQCTSCHDTHNLMGNEKMLVIMNAKSRLCLTCHIK